MTQIQPQGEGLSALWATFECYSALRKLGLNVDIVSPDQTLDDYSLVIVPCLPIVPDALATRLAAFSGQVIIGPRTGSRNADFAIPLSLPPGDLTDCIGGTVTLSESLRPGLEHAGDGWRIARWLDHLTGSAEPELIANDGTAASYRNGAVRYCATWPQGNLIAELVRRAADDAGLATVALPEGMRMRRTEAYRFVFNYAAATQEVPSAISGGPIVGSRAMSAAGIAIFQSQAGS